MKDQHNIIEVEVHRKALYNFSKEMAITLMRTSGSPVVTDAKDFSTCILDTNNEQLAFSGFVSFHISTAFLGVEAVLRNYDINEIKPGDAFICNDPHTSGAIHQGDVGIVTPYFYNGQHIGWGYVNEHVLDVGGSAVSGFAPEARDCYSEALRFSGIRIMNEGVLSPDWEKFIETNVRMSNLVLNDIRGMIAANNVGQMRLENYIDQIGIERYFELNKVTKQLSAKAFRERIKLLPDGTYESEDWVEYDGHGPNLLFNLKCRMIIDGEKMTIQFRGDPQTDCFINGAKPAILGQAMTTILCQLIYDIPVNSGVWEPIEFDLGPEGTIVNSVEPAPVTQSHMETGMRINKLISDVISQAVSMSSSHTLQSRVAGQPSNGITSFTAYGVDNKNQPFVIFPISTAVGLGGGAQSVTDGLDSYAAQCMTGCGMPDVEIDESSGPILVLWRRINQNSGGPGVYRGGQGMSSAMALYYAKQMTGTAFTSVSEVPPRGMFGGYPGSASNYYFLRSTNLLELLENGEMPTLDTLNGEIQKMPSKTGSLNAVRGDIFIVDNGGGGGLGDPLLRPIENVVKDVQDGYITVDHAKTVYGVEITNNGTVNIEKTEKMRQFIREQRIGHKIENIAGNFNNLISYKIRNNTWVCTACGYELAPKEENWRNEAVFQEKPIHEKLKEFGMSVRQRENPTVVTREYFCPKCASCLSVDVTLEGKEAVPSAKVGTKELFEKSVVV